MGLQFGSILVFLLAGAAFILAALVFGSFLRPRHGSRVKETTYECGEPPWGHAWFNFNPRFYMVALIFIVFDVEIAFMYPVVTVFRRWVERGDGLVALAEIVVFMAILLAGLAYAWKNGDFDWARSIRTDDHQAGGVGTPEAPGEESR